MKERSSKDKKGFTIIEVALVLAIAGLIFLMVFVALPGLRASQRDADRREAVASFLENVKKYQTNNRGALPGATDNASISESGSSIMVTNGETNSADTTWAGFYQKYLGDNFIDPDGENYKLKIIRCGSTADKSCVSDAQYSGDVTFPNNYTMLVVLQASCLGTETIGTSNPRKLAVIYKLEGAGTYCSDI